MEFGEKKAQSPFNKDGPRLGLDKRRLQPVIDEIERLRDMITALAEEDQVTEENLDLEHPPAEREEQPVENASSTTPSQDLPNPDAHGKSASSQHDSTEPPPEIADLLETIRRRISDPKALESGYTLVLAMIEAKEGKERQSMVGAVSETDLGRMLVSDEDLVLFATAFTNAARLRILRTLSHGERTWADLSQDTGLVGGQLYHHLKELIRSGFVIQKNRNTYAISPWVGKPAYLGMNLLARSIQRAAERWAKNKEEPET